MIVLWIAVLVVGVAVAAAGSRRAVDAALDTSESMGVASGLVGVSVIAIGTDLPEIANSVMASVSGHGDLNVGDSTGSALTQITLVLVLLLLASGLHRDLRHEDTRVAVLVGVATVCGLGLLAALLADGRLGRVDGLILVAAWLGTLVLTERRHRGARDGPAIPDGEVGAAIGRTMLWLGVVGIAATAIVRSFIAIIDRLGAPEFVASTLVLALGTSLPELVVDWTAIRRGAAALAIGDLFGSSLVDSTLSVGIGPVVRGVAVSDEALIGTLLIAGGVALATITVAVAHRRATLVGALAAIYAVTMGAVVALAA